MPRSPCGASFIGLGPSVVEDSPVIPVLNSELHPGHVLVRCYADAWIEGASTFPLGVLIGHLHVHRQICRCLVLKLARSGAHGILVGSGQEAIRLPVIPEERFSFTLRWSWMAQETAAWVKELMSSTCGLPGWLQCAPLCW